jgi:hypothetical protein
MAEDRRRGAAQDCVGLIMQPVPDSIVVSATERDIGTYRDRNLTMVSR